MKWINHVVLLVMQVRILPYQATNLVWVLKKVVAIISKFRMEGLSIPSTFNTTNDFTDISMFVEIIESTLLVDNGKVAGIILHDSINAHLCKQLSEETYFF